MLGPYALLIKIAGLAVVLALIVDGIYRLGYGNCETKWERNMAKAAEASQKAADEKEAEWQDKFNTNARNLVHEINTIAATRDRLAVELRNRPSRAELSEAARAGCKGGTGAELSNSDAEFLTRLAARADEQRAALMACYADIDAILNQQK